MKLTPQQLANFLNDDGVYDGSLITQLFAYRFAAHETSPLGNIFQFKAPLQLGPLNIEEGLVLVGEMPNISKFGAACFQRLYITQLGSLLSVLTGKEFYVEENCLMSDGLQYSISILNQVKDSVTFHIVFPLVMYKAFEGFGLLDLTLTNDIEKDFVDNAIEAFNFLTKTIFLETRRDNF
jgi:hypothetical protein